jgi:hypothetical protein
MRRFRVGDRVVLGGPNPLYAFHGTITKIYISMSGRETYRVDWDSSFTSSLSHFESDWLSLINGLDRVLDEIDQ